MPSSASVQLAANASSAPLIDTLRKTTSGRIAVSLSATLFVAICAHISVPLPYTPVPLVLSDFAVLLVGMLLGPVDGFLTMIIYLAEGAAGAPVFSPQGLGGVLQLVGPTGGYLFSYPLAAAIAGLTTSLARRGRSVFTAGVFAGTVATATILACGAAWLSHRGYMTSASTWSIAVTPFLFGSLAKIVAATVVFASTRRWLRS
jgi:biotin transport system substrate-specific component